MQSIQVVSSHPNPFLSAQLCHPASQYSLRDWQQLHEAHGIQWLLAAPLGSSKSGTCQEHQRASLGYREHRTTLDAVLVGGQGPVPTIDAVWLSKWALEMVTSSATPACS